MVKYLTLAVFSFLCVAHFSVGQKALKPDNPRNKPEQKTADVPKSWLQEVKQNIRQRQYHISKKTDANTWQGSNRAQNLHFTYKSGQVRMQPLTNKSKQSDWQLNLKTKGLYADGRKVQRTSKKAKAQVEDSMAVFRHGPMKIQYLNRKQGMRQNFVVEKLPNKPENLTVRLEAEGLDIRQISEDALAFVGDKEGENLKKLNYKGLKVWDANGNPLSAEFKVKKEQIAIQVKAKGAAYPITIDPLSTSADWIAEINQYKARFGWSVSKAGDVNGDGYGDVIIGAPFLDVYNEVEKAGAAYVFHGSSNGLQQSYAWKVSVKEDTSSNSDFGRSVSNAGDVNGDGYDDVIIGAHNCCSALIDKGRAYVYHGGQNGLDTSAAWIYEGDSTIINGDSTVISHFGISVSYAGDVNNDGYDDVIVGADRSDDRGAALAFLGSSNGLSKTPDWQVLGEIEFSRFGFSVSNAGDVNGDNYDDVIVGAPFYEDGKPLEGKAYLYLGNGNGLSKNADWVAYGGQRLAQFGFSVNTAGDVNGDQYSDVIIGANLYSKGGAAFVYYGNPNGLNKQADWQFKSKQNDAELGRSVASVGDVNNDGFDDVIIGSPYYDSGRNSSGNAYIFKGRRGGLKQKPSWKTEQFGTFGQDVSSAGDVNGDGYDDVLIGADGYTNGQEEEGGAFVYYGNCLGKSPPTKKDISLDDWSKYPKTGTLQTYSIEPVKRADTVKWTFSDNWEVTRRSGDTLIKVKIGDQKDTICLQPANNCGRADDTCIVITPVNPEISDTTLCTGARVEIGPSLFKPKSFKWNIGDTTQQIQVDTSGTYAYEAIMQDSTIYQDTAKVTFTPKPQVYVGPSKQAFCGQIDTTLDPETKNARTYRWNTGDTTKTLYVDEEGQYWLRVESEESCANADTTELQEIANPESLDTSQLTVCQDEVTLDAGNPGASHQWNTGDTTQTLTVRTDGRYTVKIANQFCTIRDTVQVKVDVEEACPYLWVPNSFSPNDDGLNDVFKPKAQKLTDYQLTIYNRWGQRVFQSAKVSEGWDGTFDGQKAPSGAYMYQIVYRFRNADGVIRQKLKEGTIQVVR